MNKGVFISYSHEDKEAVDQIVSSFGALADVSVWYDDRLRGGQNFFAVIAEKILASPYFVFVVSRHSVASEWCIHELQFAMSEHRQILTIWLDDVVPPPQIRLVISNTHYIRKYELDESAFTESLRESFSSEKLSHGDQGGRGSDDAPVSGRNRYFLTKKERSEIRQCLHFEKEGAYSKCFESRNALLLGMAYEMGYAAEQNDRRAEFYYRVAAHKGDLDGAYLLAALHMPDKFSEQQISEMNTLADSGSVRAQVSWGDIVFDGRAGVPADRDRAIAWWKRAAEAGDPCAMYFLAYCYRNGVGVPEDEALALMYALSSSEHGFPRAFRILGFIYQYGEFVDKDREKAYSYFREAVRRNDATATNSLGNMLWNDEKYDEAYQMYEKAVAFADEGMIRSGNPYYNMAWCYRKGYGAPLDPDKAVFYYLKAAARGRKAARNEAVRYIIGNIDSAEKKLAYLKQASETDCQDAEYWLAFWSRPDGNGIEEHDPEALAMLEKGAEKGDLRCMRHVLDFRSSILGQEGFIDRKKSLETFRMYFSLWESLQDVGSGDKGSRDSEEIWNMADLAMLYNAYALELDVDTENDNPDHEHALFYYRKCLETNGGFYLTGTIVDLAEGYLSIEDGDADDPYIRHGIAMLEMLHDYLPSFLEYEQDALNDNYLSDQEKTEVLSTLMKCMQRALRIVGDAPESISLKKWLIDAQSALYHLNLKPALPAK